MVVSLILYKSVHETEVIFHTFFVHLMQVTVSKKMEAVTNLMARKGFTGRKQENICISRTRLHTL